MHHLSQNVKSDCKICQHPNWEQPASADSAMGSLPLSPRIPPDSSLQPPDRPKLCIIKNIRLTKRQWTSASGRLHRTIDTPRLFNNPTSTKQVYHGLSMYIPHKPLLSPPSTQPFIGTHWAQLPPSCDIRSPQRRLLLRCRPRQRRSLLRPLAPNPVNGQTLRLFNDRGYHSRVRSWLLEVIIPLIQNNQGISFLELTWSAVVS